MADIQQQIADGARPRLARVGDVIEHGQDIPANVLWVKDEVADGKHEHCEGLWYEDGVECDGTPYSAEKLQHLRGRLTVVEVDPEPQPIVLTLPVVPDGAVALIGNKTGKRYTWDPYRSEYSYPKADLTTDVWWTNYAAIMQREHPEGVTVEMAPPPEPRTWPKLDPAPADLRAVEVEGHGIFRRHPNTDGWVNDEGILCYWREVLDLGEVREVLT